ncbi:hypothetical protein sscle_09g073640 [Sclerotinia sclerotiorum 1980 UF-70]|uniref:Uncharacterized protein n=1 Tax=Sclerotinia sclerotiorum (strain ATCC 18683 / 1980 / Ss-1) TaxID=665079 RepID=A0A1D9QCB5_SCLS1|nr:hypothetical protein sscle_09g073640 [Sclerotinia sclerotiorum 1980 UF-70]
MNRCMKSPTFYPMSDQPVTDIEYISVTAVITISRELASVASSIQNRDAAEDLNSAFGNNLSTTGARGSAPSSSS